MTNTSTMAAELGISSRRVLQLEKAGVLAADLDDAENAARYRAFSAHDIDGVCADIERLVRDLERGMARLRKASPDQRAKVATEVGPLIGRLDRTFSLSNAMAAPRSRDLLTNYTNFVVGGVIGEFLSLANLQLADGDP